jgi:hypothetical protein
LADRHRRRSFIGKTLPMQEKQDFAADQANAVAAGGSGR